MPPVRALLALSLLAGCAQMVTPPGARSPGVADMRAIETTGRTGLRVLGLTQGTVRACSGAYAPPTRAAPTRTTELACTGGVTGTATVGPDRAGGRSVRWALETGESGRTSL